MFFQYNDVITVSFVSVLFSKKNDKLIKLIEVNLIMSEVLNHALMEISDIVDEQRELKRGITTYDEQLTRRERILSLKERLRPLAFPDTPEKDAFSFIEETLKLENFMLSVPPGVQVVPQQRLKKNTYTSMHGSETRLYFCPHFELYDNDSLSVVVALTPPEYTQPLHAHFATLELTIATMGPMDVVFKKGFSEYQIEVPRGSLSSTPKGLVHTIRNNGKKTWAHNISVKIPDALGDRYNIPESSFCIEKPDNPHIITPWLESTKSFSDIVHELDDSGWRYMVELIDFYKKASMTASPKSATDVYLVTQGGFQVYNGTRRGYAGPWSLIVVDNGEKARIVPARSDRPSSLYRVTLLNRPNAHSNKN